MADQQELIILLQAQVSDALTQLAAVQQQVTSMNATTAAAAAPVTKLGSVFGGMVGGVAVAAVNQLSRKLVTFGKDAVDAFTKSDAAAKEFQNTLMQRNLTQANALQASVAVANLAGVAGFEPEEIQQAMSNVIVKMHNGANATVAFQAAMDNARIKGISLATSIQSVTIAAEGSLKSLRQFGITTNKDVNGNLKTEAQLLKEIKENTKGGLETYMNTPLGMIDRMKVSLQELKEAAGRYLTEAFAPAAQVVTGFSQSLVAMFSASSASGESLRQLAIFGARTGQVFFNLGAAVQFAINNLTPLGSIIDAIRGKKATNQDISDTIDKWVDANQAANEVVKNLREGTPQAEAQKQMEELEKLIAGIQIGEDNATKSTEKWMAAFAPLKLLSGNVPKLAMYIGNLSSTFVLRSVLDININDNTKPAGTTGQQSVKAAVTSAVATAAKFYSGSTVASHGASLWGSLFNSGGGKAHMEH